MKKFNALMNHAIANACKHHGLMHHRMISDWRDIVGSKLCKVSAPLSISFPMNKKNNGLLTIGVSNPGYIIEMQMMQKVILGKIAVYFGYPAINKIALKHCAYIK